MAGTPREPAGSGAMWGGRFSAPPDPLFRRFNDSLRFDYRLARHDVRASIAWAGAILGARVIDRAEHDRLVGALNALDARIVADPELPARSDAEDVHSWVESELVASAGALGKKLHTGRSRNDQVATDLRLWVREEIDARADEVRRLQRSLVAFARRESGVVLPGYTHLQRAQPVLLSHWALAYAEMLDRDRARFADARARLNHCPLGSGALAGTAYPIDRASLARALGFSAPTANSLDAVSDRDFAIETLGAALVCALHLSRLAEDLIIYSTQEFAFVEQADSVSSGSSLMPQKKNPDALELLRAKCGRILGAHAALATVVKGLPLAYNKDLQEDKEPVFDAMDTLSMCLRMAVPVVDGMTVRREACERAARAGHANATDLADYLVSRGVPFREAHETVGRIVRRAIQDGCAIEQLPLARLREFSPLIGDDVFRAVSLEAGMARREVPGATGTRTVAAAIDEFERRLGTNP